VRRMRKIHCPGTFRVVPWDSRFYALFQGEELICVTVYKTGAVALMNRLHHLSRKGGKLDKLVSDLWWFIENVNEEDPNCSENFFALRARVRTHNTRKVEKSYVTA
jgi:hypothetical protein